MKNITLTFIILNCILFQVNAQWQRTINAPEYFTYLGINCLAINGSNIFAGSGGNPDGNLFLSTNKGAYWTALGAGFATVNALAIQGNNIFAAGSGDEAHNNFNYGVHLSSNNGSNWISINNGLTDTFNITSIVISGANIYASAIEPGGVFWSNDTGANWSPVLSRQNVYCLAASGSNVFAGTEGGVSYSTNEGVSWTQNDSLPNNGNYNNTVNALAIMGSLVFAGTTEGVLLSTDTGKNWVESGIQSSEVFSLLVNGTNIFAGTDGYDGGVFLSTDSGKSWNNTGLTNFRVLSLATSGGYIYAGSQDSGGVWINSLSNILGVENLNQDNNYISIYPNPATYQLTIQTSSFQTNKPVTVSILNMLGEVMLSRSLFFGEDRGEAFDVSRLAAGMYFVQLKSGSGSVVKKFVKE